LIVRAASPAAGRADLADSSALAGVIVLVRPWPAVLAGLLALGLGLDRVAFRHRLACATSADPDLPRRQIG